MDIAASSDTAVRLPAIEVRPKTGSDAATAAPKTASGADSNTPAEKPDFWHRTFGKDGFTFSTLLDIVNPLQHIPVVSTIYQKVTGDVASPGANLIGGALFGGVVGLAVAGADTAIKDETGKDIGGHVFAMFESDKSDNAQTPVVAAASTPDDQTIVDTKNSTSAVVADAGDSQKTEKAAAAPVATPAIKAAAAAPAAKPTTQAKQVNLTTPFPFAMGAAKRHAAGNGIGGSFVPLETRASIAPAAFTVATTPTDEPGGNIPKMVQKSNDVTVPDLQTLASNPGMLLELQKNGLRKTANKPNGDNAAQAPGAVNIPLPPRPAAATLNGSAPGTATPAAADPAAVNDTSAGNDNAGGDNNGDYTALMARNLARYMALQNKNALAKVNQRY